MAGKKKSLSRSEVEALEQDGLLGAAPITRATAQANALAKASAAHADYEHLGRIVTADLDHYDSYWSRDPGRANGPYS